MSPVPHHGILAAPDESGGEVKGSGIVPRANNGGDGSAAMHVNLGRATVSRGLGRPGGGARRLLTVLAALLVLLPGALVAGPAQARTAARTDCQDAAAILGTIGSAAGILPGGGQLGSLLTLLSGIGGNWVCGQKNVAELMMEIARAQAQLVFDENTVKIIYGQLDNQVKKLAGLGPLTDPNNDDQITTRVDTLNEIWGALDGIEPTGGTLSFAALPAMTALAGTKMATLTLALETEKVRPEIWRKLQADRKEEARQSRDYLDGLKTQLEQHITERFTRHIQTYPNQCGIVHCVSKARIYTRDNHRRTNIYDSGVMSWSGIIAPNPAQQPEYRTALTRADSAINNGRATVRNAYITPQYNAVRTALQAHITAPNLQLFQLRKSPCNVGQDLILQSVTHDFLTVTARGGISDGTSLWLVGDLDFAKSHDASQFEPIRYGNRLLYKVRGVGLTWHADGGSSAGTLIRLHGDQNFAEHHPESLFETYLTAGNHLIFKVSDRDLTIGLSNGEHTGSELVLDKPLAAAVTDKSSRFRFVCYPDARR